MGGMDFTGIYMLCSFKASINVLTKSTINLICDLAIPRQALIGLNHNLCPCIVLGRPARCNSTPYYQFTLAVLSDHCRHDSLHVTATVTYHMQPGQLFPVGT